MQHIDCRLKLCKRHKFCYINHVKKIVYLENPKVASSLIRESLHGFIEINRSILEKDVKKYSSYYVFGVYRDPVDRIVSTYKDFCRSNKGNRIVQMSNTFNLSTDKIKNLSFSEFIDLAIKYPNHHWNPNYRYLHIPNLKVDVVQYTELHKLQKKLSSFGIDLNLSKKVNQSVSVPVTVDEKTLDKIKKMFKEDYDHFN